MRLYTIRNAFNRTFTADIARIYTHFVATVFNCRNCKLIRKMNIGNKRNVNFIFYFFNRLRVFVVKYGHPYYIATDGFKAFNLCDNGFHVRSLYGTHRLDGNIRPAAYINSADTDFFCLFTHMPHKISDSGYTV